MPREFTHWYVAGKVANELTGTVFENPLKKFNNLLYLGSNFHDSLFYFYKFSNNKNLKSLANVLHGSNGEDTYSIIKSLVDLIIKTKDHDHIVAFLVGVITHITTDSVFHPMVFHLAGHYSKDKYMIKSNQRHHQLEALMEFYFAHEDINRNEKSLNKFLKHAEYPLEKMFLEISRELFNNNSVEISKAILSGYKSLAITQNLALNRFLNFCADGIYPLLTNRLKDLISIRYDKRLIKKMDKISGIIKFKNPVTGDEYDYLLVNMADRSVQKSLALLKKVESHINEKKSIAWEETGPSLKSGLPSTNVEQMKHFANKFILD